MIPEHNALLTRIPETTAPDGEFGLVESGADVRIGGPVIGVE